MRADPAARPPKASIRASFAAATTLVKTGWSKKGRKEYEHKASKRVVDALAQAIARRSNNGKVFTAEDLFPLQDPQDGSEVPGYQGYVALAWLKAAGLVKQHGRRGYTVNRPTTLTTDLACLWPRLPTAL